MKPAAAALVLLALAGCRSSSSSAPVPTASASVQAVDAKAPVAVPQKPLRAAPMLFHPTWPLVGEPDGDRCDVWDLEAGLYRGSVTAPDCERWRPTSRSVPEAIANATPAASPAPSPAPDEPPQEDVGGLVAAWSSDGKMVATGRRGASEVRIWEPGKNAPLFTIPLPPAGSPSVEPARLADLAWAPGGMLCAAALPMGAFLWDPARGGGVPKQLSTDTRYQRIWLDPAARYMGGSGTIPWPKSIGRITAVVSIVDGRERLVHRTSDMDEAIRSGTKTSAVWAPESNVVFAIEARPIPAEACADQAITITALDLGTGDIKYLGLNRAVLHTAVPSPDGQALLLSATQLGDCSEEAPDQHTSKEPVTRLWRLDGEGREVWSIPTIAASSAWSPRSDAVAFVVGEQIEVHGAQRGELLGHFRGAPPLVFSPDGERLGFTEAGVFVVRPRSGKGASLKDVQDIGKQQRLPHDKMVDPSGRFELVAGPAVRRLADGGVLHFDPRRGPWTEGYAFARTPPEDWVFREGDVLEGKLVRAKEASFLAPTPDLVARFVAGKPIPTLKSERTGR